jgi:hypothetical protein
MNRPRFHRLCSLAAIVSSLALVSAASAQPTRTAAGHARASVPTQAVPAQAVPTQVVPTQAVPPGQRVAPSEVRGEVLVILASEREGTIAPELESLPALRQPPFNAFHSMTLLMRPAITLRVGEPHDLELPNGRILRIVLEAITPEGRYRVRVSINRREQQDYLPLLEIVAPPGDPFFLAGQNFMGGTMVLGVRLGERPSR